MSNSHGHAKKLWYARPAADWMEGLPVGTGRLAAMVWGGMKYERLTLNHEWLWRGNYRDRENSPVAEHLDEVRKLLLSGEYERGTQLGNEYFATYTGRKFDSRIDSYQPAGDLWIDLDHDVEYHFRRELNLDLAAANVEYRARGNGEPRFERQIVASMAEDLIFVRIAACKMDGVTPASFCARVRFDRVVDAGCELGRRAESDLLVMAGRFETGMRFECQARVWLSGPESRLEARDGGLHAFDAQELIVAIDIGTSAKGGEPAAECRLAQLERPDWPDMLRRHERAFREAMGDCSLELRADEPDLPTDERMRRVREGAADPTLPLLYFNFGRYLLACSSAWGELPAHLQGKWNQDIRPAWECDYHLDVNLQMNYWPAEPTGMGRCVEAMLKYVERLVPQGRKAAADLYGCGGICLPLSDDVWGRCTSESFGWAAWIGAAAWLAQHFWWRFDFGQDVSFLRERAYPFIKLVAEFYEDYLIEDADGQLLVVPSQSPENSFAGSGELPVSLCVNASMDLELAWDLLTHAVAAAELLDVDADKRAKWTDMLDRLPVPKVGSDGRLMEWDEEFEEVEPSHRHTSHLFGLHPGEQFDPRRTPELFRAAEKSLEARLAAGGGHTGWSRSWTACLFARLARAEDAYHHLTRLVVDFATDGLLDTHPERIFQIDGNFGGTAAVAEMLLQSYHRQLHLLPALPKAWPTGRVRGLKARGGFTVDIDWADGRLTEATITAAVAGPCRIIDSEGCYHISADGRAVPTRREGDLLVFDASPGIACVCSLS